MHSRTQKKTENDDFKLDEQELYDRQQNLKLEGVPYKEDKNMTQTVIDLAVSLNTDVKEEEIFNTHRLPLRRRRPNTREGSNRTKEHPTLIVRFVNRFKRN